MAGSPRGFDTADLQEAKALLEELAEGHAGAPPAAVPVRPRWSPWGRLSVWLTNPWTRLTSVSSRGIGACVVAGIMVQTIRGITALLG